MLKIARNFHKCIQESLKESSPFIYTKESEGLVQPFLHFSQVISAKALISNRSVIAHLIYVQIQRDQVILILNSPPLS